MLPGGDLALAVAEQHVATAPAAQQRTTALAAPVARGRSGCQRWRVRARCGGARPRGVRHARRHFGIVRPMRMFSVGGAAVGAGVAMLPGADLALAVAEPHVAAAPAAQQRATALAAPETRVGHELGANKPNCEQYSSYSRSFNIYGL